MQNKKVLNYTLLRLLGKGGMAEVWYAENQIEKPAAVKILNEDLSHNTQIVERFRNEAKVTVKLNHPNIRQVFDYDEIDGRPCMVMEYLEGDDLGSRMKHGERFSDEQLQKWWNQLASALNYTHAQGVVHRDIKPSNIFVTDHGDVKLLDFGIAKVRDGITSTATGAMMGTLMYMSPDQVRDSKHIDHKTDLYSLAVTFVHLLAGKAPYDRDTIDDYEIRKNIVETSLGMTGVPADWQAFLQPYLAKKPEDRPALTAFPTLEDEPTVLQATPISPAVAEETVVAGETIVSEETKWDAALADLDDLYVSAQDEGTVAETPEAKPGVEVGANVPAPASSEKSRKRKVWPWVLAACAVLVVVLVVVLTMRGCEGGDKEAPNPGDTAAITYQDGWITVNGVSFKMVAVKGGTFTMGCTGEQGSDCESGESSAHQETVGDFCIGETEVTQALWKAVMGSEPTDDGGWTNEYGRGDSYPAYLVSYDDIVNEFIPKLNQLTGKTFRLPTSPEWEYAARGGNKSRGYKYSGSNTLGDVAWCEDNSGGKTHPVKTKAANELGLYDMSGNVWEWCSDLFIRFGPPSRKGEQTDPSGLGDTVRRLLGGSCDFGAWDIHRYNVSDPGSRSNNKGFRLVMETEAPAPVVQTKPVPAGYVDLGLSVYWKNSNEWNPSDDHGFYTYDDAESRFGSSLPTKAQLEELKNKCTWTWTSKVGKEGYEVKGPNGNSIFLPAAGFLACDGDVYIVGSYGYYWSSTPNDSDDAWCLYFNSGLHYIYNCYRCAGQSVRLVQGK